MSNDQNIIEVVKAAQIALDTWKRIGLATQGEQLEHGFVVAKCLSRSVDALLSLDAKLRIAEEGLEKSSKQFGVEAMITSRKALDQIRSLPTP